MAEAPVRVWIGAPDREHHLTEGAWHAVDRLGDGARLELRDENPDWQWLMNYPASPFELPADLYEDVPSRFDVGMYARANAYGLSSPMQTEDVDIAGTPLLHLRARVKGRGGQIIARLGEWGADTGWSRLTTGAICVPEGDDIAVTIPLQATAWRLRQRHKLDLILCADGWPTFWPAPRETEVFVKDVRLTIPTLGAARHATAVFAAPQAARAERPQKLQWIDPNHEQIAWPPRENAPAHGATTAAHKLRGTDYLITSRFEISNATGQGWAAKSYRVAFERPGWSIRVDTRLEVASTPDAFEIAWTIRATDDGEIFHHVENRVSVPRDTV